MQWSHNIVLDTKWKIVDNQKNNYGLLQSDLYQIYAYGKKYNSNDIYLIYPKSKNFKFSIDIPFKYDDTLNLHILCFDCLNISTNKYNI